MLTLSQAKTSVINLWNLNIEAAFSEEALWTRACQPILLYGEQHHIIIHKFNHLLLPTVFFPHFVCFQY